MLTKRAALDDDALSGIGEAAADRHRDEHAHESPVEDQVSGLAEVAALGRDRQRAGGVVALRPVAGALQLGLGEADRGRGGGRGIRVRRQLDDRLAVVVEPAEPRRSARRAGPQRLPVVLRARDHAADQRDEQQDVDRREPRRRVDVEQLHAVDDRGERRVVGEVLRDAVRVGAALRNDRPWHRRDREEEQQHERGAHARELPPAPPQPPDRAEGGLDDVVAAGSGRRGVGVVGRPQRIADDRCAVAGAVRAGGGHSSSPPAAGPSRRSTRR